MKALLLENIHPEGIRVLEEAGFEVETRPGALGEDELVEALRGVDVLGIRSGTHVTEKVLEACGNDLKAVGAFCIGTNQIDLGSAAVHGVAAFNAPFSNTRSVVELTIAEIISLARHLTDKNAKMHAGIWDKSAKGSHEVRGRTLGIVGYGNIGSQLSIVAEALGMRVMFYDIADKLSLGNARRAHSLDELLASVRLCANVKAVIVSASRRLKPTRNSSPMTNSRWSKPLRMCSTPSTAYALAISPMPRRSSAEPYRRSVGCPAVSVWTLSCPSSQSTLTIAAE